jgi:hypothetical protein
MVAVVAVMVVLMVLLAVLVVVLHMETEQVEQVIHQALPHHKEIMAETPQVQQMAVLAVAEQEQ